MALIEKERLLYMLDTCLVECDAQTPITSAVLTAVKRAAEQMPEVDAVPVVHGQWIYGHWCEFKCSNCGHWSDSKPYKGRENYCPNCRAKMDGGKDDRVRRIDWAD